MSVRITLLPGDGIGPEVTTQAKMLISALADDYGLSLEMESALVGGAAIDEKGDPLPAKTLDTCRRSDAIILGAVGGPKWSDPNALVRP